MIDISPLVIKLLGAVAVVVACVVGWLSFATHYEHKGYSKAIAAIAAKDQGAISAVKDEENKVAECYSSGRTFNTVRWLCD